MLLEAVGPSSRLLKSFGVSGEPFAVELSESSPKGEWDSLLSTDLSDPASARAQQTALDRSSRHRLCQHGRVEREKDLPQCPPPNYVGLVGVQAEKLCTQVLGTQRKFSISYFLPIFGSQNFFFLTYLLSSKTV